ncbi:MAG TPA: hypothetical protein VL088_03495 [Pedobacter sp.]|nr:hypothetical protein [Pedobacter sp.]
METQRNKRTMLNLSKDYWIMLLVRIVVRVLGFTYFLFIMKKLGINNISTLESYYISLGFAFYILFFIFLDWYLKITKRAIFNGKTSMKASVLRWINYLKWIPLVLTIVLISLKVMLLDLDFPNDLYEKFNYIILKVLPIVVNDTISFILITLLIFYSCAVSNINRKLQEEQDLTI